MNNAASLSPDSKSNMILTNSIDNGDHPHDENILLREPSQNEGERTPLLFVDVNLGSDQARIVVFEGESAQELAKRFCDEHNLDEDTQEKLEELLDA